MTATDATEVRVTDRKGKCLFVKNGKAFGDLVYSEEPLFYSNSASGLFPFVQKVLDEEPAHSGLAFHWYAAAVMSLLSPDTDAKQKLALKWAPADENVSACDILVCRLSEYLDETQAKLLASADLRQHVLVWRYNSFSHYSDDKALIMYDVTSFMAHSCRPSAAWAFADQDRFSLRAIRKLAAGSELTISYLSEEQLIMTTVQRREILSGWLFECECDRCSEKTDPFRTLLCPHCSSGPIALASDMSASEGSFDCSVCGHNLAGNSLEEYLTAEAKYIERVQALEADDIRALEELYDCARQVFLDHWILQKIEAALLPYYKKTDEKMYLHLLQNKVSFYEKLKFPTYSLAWAYEELADALSSKDLYERAFHNMRAVAGEESGYTSVISNKWKNLD